MNLRLMSIFSQRTSPFGQRFRDELTILKDAVIELSELQDALARQVNRDTGDQNPMPAVTILAKITSVSGPFTNPLGADYYKYAWEEVTWTAGTPAWTTPTGPRSSSSFSLAINLAEASSSVDLPTVAVDSVVLMTVERDGTVWFMDAGTGDVPWPAIVTSATVLVADTRWEYEVDEATVNTATGEWTALVGGRGGSAYNGAENNVDPASPGLIGVGQSPGPTVSTTRNPIKVGTVVSIAQDDNGELYFSMPNGYSFECDTEGAP